MPLRLDLYQLRGDPQPVAVVQDRSFDDGIGVQALRDLRHAERAALEGEDRLPRDDSQRGNLDELVQVFTSLPGHCSFSTEQFLTTLGAMEHWLDTGVRPDAAMFPASLGFKVGFVPPPWPF